MIRRPPRSTLFPTRRSSDLLPGGVAGLHDEWPAGEVDGGHILGDHLGPEVDRKSTRLNSSHGYISYAVFCLKKKKDKNKQHVITRKQENFHPGFDEHRHPFT